MDQIAKVEAAPRVMHLAECAGGVDRYLEMLIPRLHREGVQQILVCSQHYDAEKYRPWCEVHQVPMSRSFAPWNVRRQVCRVRALIRKERPVWLYCHSSFAGGIGRLAARHEPVTVIYNPHGWAFSMKGAKAQVYLRMERLLAPVTHRYVCISAAEYDQALSRRICPQEKLQLIENGIDLRAVERAEPMGRSALRIPADAVVVGMVGRACLTKAPDTFLKACAALQERLSAQNGKRVYALIVGSDDGTYDLQRQAEQLGIGFGLTGWVNNPYAYLKLFDYAVLLSRWEGFGYAIAEYMAAQKNFVATRVGGIATLVDDGTDGFLVRPDDSAAAAEKLLWYANHPLAAQEMRARAFEKVNQRFTIDRVVRQHLELFAHA